MHKVYQLQALMIYALGMSGCAVHYHDKSDNSDHIYGFGHLAMRVASDGSKEIAIAKQVSTLGSEFHAGDQVGLSLGWSNEEEIQVFDKSARISLQRPSGLSIFSSTLNE
jgi:hypothetical protein